MDAAGLDGLRVVITREADASAAFATRLRELGAAPLICPAIEIQLRNPPGLDEALLALERFEWVAFTSANAVRAVLERCAALRLEPAETLGRTRVAAVGKSTAAVLGEYGVCVEIVPADQSGRALAAALIGTGVDGRLILMPASRIARPELGDALRAAGAGVVQLGVYDTVAPAALPRECRAALEQRRADVLTFFSPSAARNFMALAGAQVVSTMPALCIGETTAAAWREHGMSDPLIAAEASADGMLAALLEFQRRRIHAS